MMMRIMRLRLSNFHIPPNVTGNQKVYVMFLKNPAINLTNSGSASGILCLGLKSME
jgi:hypothetical protein